MDSGWVKVYRKLLDNPVVCKDADHIAVWVLMLLSATHTPQQVLFGGDVITLQPGQFVSGRKAISNKVKVNENKVNRIIKFFKSQQLIEQQASTKNSLFTILNWSEYQESEQQNEQQVNNNCTTNEQQVNTNKNERMKECKNERIDVGEKPTKRFVPPTFEEVDSYIKEKGYVVSAQRFIDFYESKNWYVGKNKMKDWKASVRGWQSRETESGSTAGKRITESAKTETRKVRSVPRIEE